VKICKENYKELEVIQTVALKYTCAFIYEMSRAYWIKSPEFSQINWTELLEARFFNQTGELHVIQEGEERFAVEVKEIDEGGCEVDFLDQEIPRKRLFQNKQIDCAVKVRQYLDYDEDGQVYVKITRLCVA
jgi:hypothetical protein